MAELLIISVKGEIKCDNDSFQKYVIESFTFRCF